MWFLLRILKLNLLCIITNMTNTLILSYTPGSTLLHKIDPRVKIISLMVGLSAILLAGNWTAYLPLTALAIASTTVARSTVREIWRDVSSLWIFYLMTLLIHLALLGTQVMQSPEIFWVGLNRGLFFVVKIALTAVYISPFFRTSHPMDFTGLLMRNSNIFPGLFKLFRRIGFVLQTTMRFLPLIMIEIERIRTVHKCRGLVLKGGLRQRISTLPAFIIPIIDSSLRRSITVSNAMVARGFDLDGVRTMYKPLNFRVKDIFASIYIMTCVIIIFLL
jgi:energy-coupling factor transport system permease protein